MRSSARSTTTSSTRTDGIDRVSTDPPWPTYLEPIVELNRNLGAMPMVGGNDAKLYPHYEESLAAMTDEIAKAQKYVHIEFYILALDTTTEPFFKALEDATARGVVVRVLFDHIACWRSVGYKQMKKRLSKIGVLWAPMLPVQPLRGKWQRPDLRNHRKLLVVDGLIAFTGSQNFIDSSYNLRANIKRGLHWKDLMVRFEGPIVAGINALFVTDWYSETDELLTRETEDIGHVEHADPMDAQVVPSGPGFEGENNLRLFNALIYAATKKVIITSPVLRARRLDALRDHDGRAVRARRAAVRVGDRRPVHGVPRAAQLLRGAAAGGRADLPVPGADHPARQALHDRRRGRR